MQQMRDWGPTGIEIDALLLHRLETEKMTNAARVMDHVTVVNAVIYLVVCLECKLVTLQNYYTIPRIVKT